MIEQQVLLVEDNPGDADLIRLRLVEGSSKAKVNCVSRLSDALEFLAKEEPALILLDLNLPDSRGAETFRKIIKHSPQIPVVILSGQDDEALATNALQDGVQDYLVKGGFSGKQLERTIRYAVERQGLLLALENTRKEQIGFKNRLLSHVSHELRTPLTCIHQYISLIADGLSGPTTVEQKDHLKIALQGVSQLQAMIRDLLEASRAENGQMRVELRCLELGSLLEQAIDMMKPAAQAKSIYLGGGIEGEIPLVLADSDRILEVLINLIDNAIKFTPAGGTVLVSGRLLEADPEAIHISVSDTGCGISAESRPLVFERLYQQPDAGDSTVRLGLGLGLFISKEIIRLHNGDIWVNSEPGQGTTFTFTLPRHSLAKLLEPVITHREKLRDAMVLIRLELTPLATRSRASRKEIGRRCMETLQRSIFMDKDLVLPSGEADTTYFVLASTDMERSSIMISRIREKLESITALSTQGAFTLTARRVETEPANIPGAVAGSIGLQEQASLHRRVREVAAQVAMMMMQSFSSEHKGGWIQ